MNEWQALMIIMSELATSPTGEIEDLPKAGLIK